MIDEKIKYLRELHGFSQSSLAKKLGITRSGVNAWEMGISVPSTQYIAELARLFKVSSDYLLGIKSASYIDTAGLTEEDIQAVYALVEYLRRKNRQNKKTDE